MKFKSLLFIPIIFLFFFNSSFAQEEEKKDVHEFKMIYEVAATPVKDQGATGTCWSFATTSFLESELLRIGKGELDLSEMFFVRHSYPIKAKKYIRYHGSFDFGQGGQAHDVMNVIRKYGMVPDEVYSGLIVDKKKHNHSELSSVLKGTLEGVVKGKKITPLWKDVINSTLDIYLGKLPEEFTYNDKDYTPISFAQNLGINPDDYIELTSYTHKPFYTLIDLEIPDNYTHDLYYNITIDELIEIMDNALANGYSIAWDGDVGKDHFLRKECYAVIPENEKDEDEKITEPEKEKIITQEMREEAFDDFSTTDDHLMHLTGLAEDQNGTKFYYTKNSWGTKERKYDGYWYMSESYVKLKTIAIMVHKDAVPKEIKAKLGL